MAIIRDMVRLSMLQYEDQADAYFKAYHLLLKCMCEDNYEDVIERMVNDTFANEADRIEIRKRINLSLNPLRQYIEAVSRVYDRGCSRTFRTKAGKIDERAVEVYSSIKDLDRMTIEINKQLNLHSTILVYVRYNPDLKRFFLEIFDRENCDVRYDNSIQDITEFKYERLHGFATADDEFIDVEWTRETHRARKKDGVSVLAGNDREVNPYGIIPVIPIRLYLGRNFWNSTRNHSLVSLGLDIAFKKTVQSFAQMYQSFITGYVSGGSIGKQTAVGPNKWLEIKVEKVDDIPTVGTLDFQANFESMQTVIENSIRLALKSKGLDDTEIKNPDNSGRALEMRYEGTQRLINATIPVLAGFEADLFKTVRRIWNVHNPGSPISDDTTLSVAFGYTSSTLSQSDLQFDLQKLKNGLVSMKDFYLKYNPGADPETSTETMRANIEEYRETFGAAGIAGGFQGESGGEPWA